MAEALKIALKGVSTACQRAVKPTRLADWMDFLQDRDDKKFLGSDTSCLTAEDFGHYLDECGDHRPEPEIAWFLPRMCELMTEAQSIRPNFGWIESFCFLSYSRYPEAWPNDRADALQRFCEALLVDFVTKPDRYLTKDHQGDLDLGTMLCAMTRYRVDAEGLIRALQALSPEVVKRSVRYWIEGASRIGQCAGRKELFEDVYWNSNSQRDVIERWGLLADAVVETRGAL